MKRIVTLLFAAGLGACATPVPKGAAIYRNISLVDPVSETIAPNAWIIVSDGKIFRVGAGAAPRRQFASTFDMDGAYATPGLIDTHAHVTLGTISIEQTPVPALRANYDPAYTEHAARMLLAHGVTTIRNPGGDADINIAYREAAATGAIAGPDALVAGPVIDRSPLPFHGLSDLTDEAHPIEAIVEAQAEKGVDYIKLYHSLTEEDVERAAAAARARGVRTIGHLGISWKKASELGVDALVHAIPASPDDLEPVQGEAYRRTARHGAFAFFEWWEAADLDSPAMQELIATLAERQTHVDLTLIAFRLAFWGDEPAVRDEYLTLSHPDLVENWNTFFRFDLGWRPEDYARAKAVWPKILRFARLLHEAGVPMTLGTDQANPFVAPGASLMQEMKLHEDAGIEKWDILRMATSEAARILRLDAKTGQIVAGLEADIVFTERNPLQSFDAFLAPRLVISNGRSFDPAALRVKPTGVAGD